LNPKIIKIIDEINKNKEKTAKLQEQLPKLERKRAELENTEIIRLVRSSSIAPDQLSSFIEFIEQNGLDRQQGEMADENSLISDNIDELHCDGQHSNETNIEEGAVFEE